MSVKIFISCVSKELLPYHKALRTDLTRHNVKVKIQEDFKGLGGDTLLVRTKDEHLLPIIKANVAPGTHIMTDEAGQYAQLNKHFTEHDATRHSAGEYVRGIVHTNSVEGYYSVFKRGMKGIYQHCAEKHLHRYVPGFAFRYSNRVRPGVDDVQRATKIIAGAVGKRLMYRRSDSLSAA